MSTTELRQAVAESLGWSMFKTASSDTERWNIGDLIGVKRCRSLHDKVPNYPTSLDACREFEKDAPPEYWILLFETLGNELLDNDENWIIVCNATAEQRCCAWLKYFGWDNEKEIV